MPWQPSAASPEPIFPPGCLGDGYIVRPFGSFAAWRDWSQRNVWTGDAQLAARIAADVKRRGLSGAWLGRVTPDRIDCRGDNYRETLMADGLNARQRAVLDLLNALPAAGARTRMRLYATEGITHFAGCLRERFPQFTGSEYAPTAEAQRRIAPVQHQDLAALTFADASFDAAISNEVFEHLPDLPGSLAELARVLVPGGTLIATFPFAWTNPATTVKATRRDDGRIEYFAEPEMHGNPMDPEGGSLVFQIPGWDILEMARAAGFSACEIVLIASSQAGIVGRDGPCLHVFAARR